MAELGSIPMKLRLRIEAGIGNTLTDIGYADIDVTLPVTVTPTEGESNVGAQVTIDINELTTGLEAAAAAFETSMNTSHGATHDPYHCPKQRSAAQCVLDCPQG